MAKYRVISEREPAFTSIQIKKGDHFIIKSDIDDNWVLCESKQGTCVLPKGYITRKADLGTMLIDFNTNELHLQEDDVLVKQYEMHGWVYGYNLNQPDQRGWAPLTHLKLNQE